MNPTLRDPPYSHQMTTEYLARLLLRKSPQHCSFCSTLKCTRPLLCKVLSAKYSSHWITLTLSKREQSIDEIVFWGKKKPASPISFSTLAQFDQTLIMCMQIGLISC